MIPKFAVNHRGGDVFDVAAEPSEGCVLWGELVKEKERRFLKKLMRQEQICFSVRDAFQISIRTVWRPEAQNHKGMIHRRGRVAMLLHDTTGRVTTSWTWLKMVQPLYQSGISVILVDLPGMGKSSINNVATMSPSHWQGQEGHILCHVLDELKVSRCHLVACGNSASALVRMLKHSPHQLEREHVLHNPVLDNAELFKDRVRGPLPNSGPRWRELLGQEYQRQFEVFLTAADVRILATFDEAGLERTQRTKEAFVQAQRAQSLKQCLTVRQLTREDITEAQIGASVPISLLFLGRDLRDAFQEALQPLAGNNGPMRASLARTSVASSLPPTLPSRAPATAPAALRRTVAATEAAEKEWYRGAFAPGSETLEQFSAPVRPESGGLTGVASSPPRAFTSDAAKREACSRMCGPPEQERRRLLSALPLRTRHNLRSQTPEARIAVRDVEPATLAEERAMVQAAMKRSLESNLAVKDRPTTPGQGFMRLA